MRRIAARPPQRQRSTQRGQILLVILVILAIGFGAAYYAFVGPTDTAIERDKITAAALAQAKDALIGYAAGVSDLAAGGRPGDLPCPDLDDSGIIGGICDTQASRIGRLPWKSLGLPDLRDGDGERLWYAVSNNFKYNTRTACAAPGDAGCLNSDARGTITVRNLAGNVVNDGTNPDPFTPSGGIAVIFSPGGVLQRQGAAARQDRSCTGVGASCTAAEVCNSVPVTLTPKCNPINYLDVVGPPVLTVVGATGSSEDNADFIDGISTANGFINGVIRDAGGNAIVNDRLLVITYEDLMPVLQRRVAKEALNCLNLFAADVKNKERYPWASSMASSSGAGPYDDTVGTRFGRLPDTLTNTARPNLPAVVCTLPGTPPFCMTDSWVGACSLTQGTWWRNWKNLVLYGVAQPYQPDWTALPLPGIVPISGGCGGACPGPTCCLTVNPPAAAADKRVVVLVAGKRLAAVALGQPRTSVAERSDPANYLEGTNVDATPYTYEQQPMSASFNDFLLYQ